MKPTKSKSAFIADAVYGYLVDNWLREPAVLERLREETAPMEQAGMQISPEQGQFMAFLVRLLGVRRYLEVGVFTGYSSIAVGLAMPPDGRIVACDVSEDYTAVGRRFWARAGVAGKIELRLGPAVDTVNALLEAGEAGRFDFAFIDADKTNYDAYYEGCLKLLRPGGLVAVDNVLWGGSVADPKRNDADTRAIKRLNAKIRKDERVTMCLVPISDGMTLALKR